MGTQSSNFSLHHSIIEMIQSLEIVFIAAQQVLCRRIAINSLPMEYFSD